MYWEVLARDTGDIEDYSQLDGKPGPIGFDENDDIIIGPMEPHPLGKQRVIELSWGWTPFGEIPKDLADDAPTGHESVYILEEQLPRLIERLQSLIKQ